MAFIASSPLLFTTFSRSSLSSHLQKLPAGGITRIQRQVSLHRGSPVLRQHGFSSPRMADGAPPIDAPSGVLLLSSSVLAIASVGCVFELTSGHPQYGAQVTSAVLAVSLPGFVFLFYSAIRKGQQEALDDP